MEKNSNNFGSLNRVVLVDFWAPWCRYCILLEPVLKELESKFKDGFSIAKVNVDESPEIAQEYGVMSLPTLILFKDGKEVDVEITDRSIEGLTELISSHI